MADNNDFFCMLAVEDKMDGTKYPLWSYMIRHVLVAKGLWNIVAGIDVRPASRAKNAGIVVDEVGTSTTSTTQVPVVKPPTHIREGGMDEMHSLMR